VGEQPNNFDRWTLWLDAVTLWIKADPKAGGRYGNAGRIEAILLDLLQFT